MAELQNRTVFMAIGSCVLLVRQKVVNGRLEVWESRIFTQEEFKRISQVRFGKDKENVSEAQGTIELPGWTTK